MHRHVHESKSTVFALPQELDTWLASRTESAASPPASSSDRAPSGLLRRVLPAAAIVVALAFGALYFVKPPGSSVSAEGSPALSEDPLAADLYRRARALWQQRGEEPNARAIKLLNSAVERDENFALAWSALASAWATYPTYAVDVSARRAEDESMLAARRALALDPTLAEPRSLMAGFAQRRGDWAESERIYEEALKIDPDNADVLLWYAGHYREVGMFERSRELTTRAQTLAPGSPPVLTEIAMNHLGTGNAELSESMLRELWFEQGLETPIVWCGLWVAAVIRGDVDFLLDWVALTPFPGSEAVLQRYVLARQEAPARRANIDSIVADLTLAHQQGLPGFLTFELIERLDRLDAAFDIVEAEMAAGGINNTVVMFTQDRPGRVRSPRFESVAERLGFIAYWRERGLPSFCFREPDLPLCRRLGAGEQGR